MTEANPRRAPGRLPRHLDVVFGLVAIAASWFFSSGSASTGIQALWLNIGVAGAVIAGIGNCVWLLRGRRAVGQRRTELISLGRDRDFGSSAGTVPTPDVTDTLSMPLGVVRAAGMHKIHRQDCPLLAGKRFEPVDLRDGEPCGVCEP
ncbi:MAG: hypothetical protein GEV04_24940 [Actinophytocola sp.]|nr:hypothetical protein [Actinophytocola sp.]